MEQTINIIHNVCKLISDKLVMKYLLVMDKQISINLNAGQIETRPAKSNGIWCCLLLPLILIIYNTLFKVSPIYTLVTYVSIGLLFYSVLFLIFLSISCLVLKDNVFGGCVASSMLSCLFMYTFLLQDLAVSLAICVPSIYLYSMLLRKCLTETPRTFTVGEAMIVSQSTVLFGVLSLITFVKQVVNTETKEEDIFIGIVNTALLTVALIIGIIWYMTEQQRVLSTFITIMGCAVVFALTVLHLFLGINIIAVLLHSLFLNVRIKLISFWLFLVGITICILVVRTRMGIQATTASRKSFHILGSIVFLSGILYDINLIKLASGVGLAAIVLVEVLRKSGIEPISSGLQLAFKVYADEKDSGTFAMTPLYLFVGLSGPLVLVPAHTGAVLECMCGVLAVGVGDAAASCCGNRYGSHRWDNNKSLEGTICNILSQILTVYLLQVFGLLHVKYAIIRTCVAATLNAIVEAKTDQVDNLVLPLVSLLGFQLTWFLC